VERWNGGQPIGVRSARQREGVLARRQLVQLDHVPVRVAAVDAGAYSLRVTGRNPDGRSGGFTNRLQLSRPRR
jgi:hypothetical protein